MMPNYTWAFFFGPPGQEPRQFAAGMSTLDMIAHVKRVRTSNPDTSYIPTYEEKELRAVGGPNDGSRWIWVKEQ